jgi:hypothetical protein
MNDASRELGAALGVAVLGSLAASKYSSTLSHLTSTLPSGERDTAQSSLAGALETATKLPELAGKALTTGAEHAFIDGFHLAVTAGALLALTAAALVLRYLPRDVAHEGSMSGPIGAIEDTAELGIGGVPPIFADEPY